MWPWGHLAVGYLLYIGGTHLFRTGQERFALLVLVLSTQLPDLVDKPLSWLGVFVTGRALAHSLLFALPLCAVVLYIAWRSERRQAGGAFAVGYLSHLVADGWYALVTFQFDRVTYLVWPLLPQPADSGEGSAVALLTGAALRLERGMRLPDLMAVLEGRSSGVFYQLLLVAFVLLVWVVRRGLTLRRRPG